MDKRIRLNESTSMKSELKDLLKDPARKTGRILCLEGKRDCLISLYFLRKALRLALYDNTLVAISARSDLHSTVIIVDNVLIGVPDCMEWNSSWKSGSATFSIPETGKRKVVRIFITNMAVIDVLNRLFDNLGMEWDIECCFERSYKERRDNKDFLIKLKYLCCTRFGMTLCEEKKCVSNLLIWNFLFSVWELE
ncbi:hypothetical protein C1645_739375 [Glomus cerebriforme]|uniref:Uncharacterized protein n=1 Tax=Glomus cerebriforme TaxID=658196 RepID=A0A397SQP8_9GLOM|nr:hypothetical protein C1645_739375 [Glomus cerebriforme]